MKYAMQPIIVHALFDSILRLSNSKKNKLSDDLFFCLYSTEGETTQSIFRYVIDLYTVSQKCHYIYKSMWAIFCKIVTQYVLNQKILCFPTSPN